MRSRLRPGSASLDALLDGDRDDGTALARVLTAARASGMPHEMAGLDAARAAFLRARHAPARRPVTTLSAATTTAAVRLLALKAIVAISGATLIGGVAYAATSTDLLGGSSPHQPRRHQPAAPTSGSGSASSGDPVVHPGKQHRTTVRPNQAIRTTDQAQPQPAAPENTHGRPSATPSTHASPSAPQAPPATTRSDRPSSTPSATPPTTSHRRPLPSQVPSNPGRGHHRP